MRKAFAGWVYWFLFLFLLDFTVPFILLKNNSTLSGSFLFWTIWVTVAIVSMFIIFLRWKDNGANDIRG
jgi:hypothetical protein